MQVGSVTHIDAHDRDAVHEAFRKMWGAISAEVETVWGGIGPNKTQSPLYHYTTAAGLKGIITSGAIYLTDALYLSDKSELSYGRDLASEVLADRGAQVTGPLRSFFAERVKSFDPLYGPDFQVAFYVASLCSRSDLLSQWRTYGGGALGYALGFDVDSFNDRSKMLYPSFPQARLHRIEYDRKSQREVTEFVVDRCGNLLRADLKVAANKHERAVLESGWFALLVVQLSGLLPRFKHPIFSEELEWRLTCPLLPHEEDKLISYREVGADLVPYMVYPLKLADSDRLPLVELVVAPASEAKLQRRTLSKFLRDAHYPEGTVRIIEPKIPLSLRPPAN